MSEKLFPCGNPKDLAAELFRACAREEVGNLNTAAHKAAYYLFAELAEQLVHGGKARSRKLMDEIADTDDAEKIDAAFSKLRIGRERASRVFLQFGEPPSKKRLNEIEDMSIIDRLDMMIAKGVDGKPLRDADGLIIREPNKRGLALEMAREEFGEPPTERQIETILRRINRIDKERNKNPAYPQRWKGRHGDDKI
jgi:hypothetical protein